jgi:hypothetical protein
METMPTRTQLASEGLSFCSNCGAMLTVNNTKELICLPCQNNEPPATDDQLQELWNIQEEIHKTSGREQNSRFEKLLRKTRHKTFAIFYGMSKPLINKLLSKLKRVQDTYSNK